MKFPYGIADFYQLITEDYFYVDRTGHIPAIETAGRRHADLTMIVRPDARQYQVFDLLLEFKFLKPGDLRLSGEQLRGMNRAELAALPAVGQKLAEARAQAVDYLNEVRGRIRMALRPRIYAVVAIGFERVVCEEIETASAFHD